MLRELRPGTAVGVKNCASSDSAGLLNLKLSCRAHAPSKRATHVSTRRGTNSCAPAPPTPGGPEGVGGAEAGPEPKLGTKTAALAADATENCVEGAILRGNDRVSELLGMSSTADQWPSPKLEQPIRSAPRWTCGRSPAPLGRPQPRRVTTR